MYLIKYFPFLKSFYLRWTNIDGYRIELKFDFVQSHPRKNAILLINNETGDEWLQLGSPEEGSIYVNLDTENKNIKGNSYSLEILSIIKPKK